MMPVQYATAVEVDALVDADRRYDRGEYRVIDPGHVAWVPTDVEPIAA